MFHTSMKKTTVAVVTLLLAFVGSPAFAQTTLNANDMTAGPITAPTPFDTFTVLAKADKSVVVEAMDKSRTAADGEVFNARIKLGGAGGAEFRAIQFTVAAKAEVTVYTNSSSKTDARILKVADETGAVVAELSAPADDEATSGTVKAVLPQAGTYRIFSGSGGINLYQITVK